MNWFLKKMGIFFLLLIWTWYKVPGICRVSLSNWSVGIGLSSSWGNLQAARCCRHWATIESVTGLMGTAAQAVQGPSPSSLCALLSPLLLCWMPQWFNFSLLFQLQLLGKEWGDEESHHDAWVILNLYSGVKLVVFRWWPALPVL